MEIINEHWFPLLREFVNMPSDVNKTVMVYEEEAGAAGFFDPDEKMICVNVAPNCLAEVAPRYGFNPRDFNRTALAVFFEEAAHSRGITDETEAEQIAAALANKVPADILQERGGIMNYIKRKLEEIECSAGTVKNGDAARK